MSETNHVPLKGWPAAEKLRAFLQGPPRRSQQALAEAIGVAQQTLSSWGKGTYRPGYRHRFLIEKATAGAVTVSDWLTPEELEAEQRAEEFGKAVAGATGTEGK